MDRAPSLELSKLVSLRQPPHRALSALFWAMVALTVVALAGLLLDPRLITGAPAWLKPLKFSLSTAIYAVSFAWLLQRLQGTPRRKRALSAITAATLALELALIFIQAARGRQSHFNVATAFDTAVFNAMGLGIAVLWVVQIVVAVLLLRQRFEDVALGRALQLGMALTVLGASVGWLMVMPSAAQVDAFRHGLAVLSGAHTVGGPDGGAGLPLTNWSLEHGDLRVAHFFGLHALQLIPLFALLVKSARGLTEQQRSRLVLAASASYAVFFLLLLAQALRGEPLASPGAATLGMLSFWALGSLAALGAALRLAPTPSQGMEDQR